MPLKKPFVANSSPHAHISESLSIFEILLEVSISDWIFLQRSGNLGPLDIATIPFLSSDLIPGIAKEINESVYPPNCLITFNNVSIYA